MPVTFSNHVIIHPAPVYKHKPKVNFENFEFINFQGLLERSDKRGKEHCDAGTQFLQVDRNGSPFRKQKKYKSDFYRAYNFAENGKIQEKIQINDT